METQALTDAVTTGPLDYLIILTDTLIFVVIVFKLLTNRTLTSSTWYHIAFAILALGSLWKAVVSVLRVFDMHLPNHWDTGWLLQPLGIFFLVVSTLGMAKGSTFDVDWRLPWHRNKENNGDGPDDDQELR